MHKVNVNGCLFAWLKAIDDFNFQLHRNIFNKELEIIQRVSVSAADYTVMVILKGAMLLFTVIQI